MVIELKDLPDISFVDTDITKILNDKITGYEEAYYKSTGQRKKLYPGDPIRIFLYTEALRELQLRVKIDDAAKQNLLKYARKDNLQHLGALSRTELLKEQPALVKMKFHLSKTQTSPGVIPARTRVSPESRDIYFENVDDVVIPSGVNEIEFKVICTEYGEIGNGFSPGEINVLVDPLPWVDSVENIEASHSGADEEDVESYRERIYLAPEGFSVAGPTEAYKYYTKEYSALIDDVKISSPNPSEVDVAVLLNGGEIPDESFLEGLTQHLSDKKKRPLTDKVTAKKPGIIDYELNVKYYINSNNFSEEATITKQVEEAINDYIKWQKSKIDRDINPSRLISKVIEAGAKRIEIISPEFKSVDGIKVAKLSSKSIEYGGLEDE